MRSHKPNRALIETAQGLLLLPVLWYAMRGDATRLPPAEWVSSTPGGLIASSPVFLACMLLLFALEGLKAATRKATPVRAALRVYAGYWKVAVPLTCVGYAFFRGKHREALYSPMFTNPSPLNLARAVPALTNNLHEGAWLVSCLALCAFCAALYAALKRKGRRLAPLVLAAGPAVAALLYFVVMPFHYHKAVFPVAAVLGAAGYVAARLLAPRLPLKKLPDPGRAVAPLRWLGRHWAQLWIAFFFAAYYFYGVASSVYQATGSMPLAYPVFLALTCFTVYGLERCWDDLARAWRASKWSPVSVIAMLTLPFALHFALEVSSDYGLTNYLAANQWPYYTLAACAGILCLIALLRAVVGRWHVAGIIAAALFTVLAVANHFTIIYHGTLLTPEDIANITTAANVAGGYDLSIDAVTWRALLCGGAGLALCVIAWLAFRGARPAFRRRRRWSTRALCLVGAAVAGFFLYFSKAPIVEGEVQATWNKLYAGIGYFNGTVEYLRLTTGFTVREPAAYDPQRVDALADAAEALPAAAQADDLPDIIMILNETWYDLDDFMDTHADADYMANFEAMDNAVKGRVVVPLVGGGTNASEYESLTGNSSALINAYSPFNRMDMSGAVSLPAYLKQFGYNSFAAHPMLGSNYDRGRRWAQMGFDATYFIEDFTDLDYYGKRKGAFKRCTDLSAFQNMVRFYEALPEDGPRLGYFITIQSHGSWDANPPELALVHTDVSGADEALTNKLNEYLSCVRLTDEAILYLQEYYTELYEMMGRRVVVCMFGDHCTSLIRDMDGFSRYDDPDDRELAQKSTPYFIWANYPLDPAALNPAGADTMDLCCLMPTVLDVAGVPLSYYYRHIVDMRADVSVFTNVGANYTSSSSDTVYRDRAGDIHTIDEGGPLADRVIDYYCMEYDLVASGKKRHEALYAAK